jgi:dGTPase
MTMSDPSVLEARMHDTGPKQSGDKRTEYQRDRGRVLHSAAFRRLQGKTQVMGAGEGDFHRTRLTHSIECAQVGAGLLHVLESRRDTLPDEFRPWLPDRDLIEAACFAHDLGHPPFGHGGEQALQAKMWEFGGFEGNGQTLRILTKLEKARGRGQGVNPTRRLILAVLKYPVPYGTFDRDNHRTKPPKCFFDEEWPVVNWALDPLPSGDRAKLLERSDKGKALHRTFDSALMELADDIAYGVHDIEDIIARQLASRDEVSREIKKAFHAAGGSVQHGDDVMDATRVIDELFADSFRRKAQISAFVNLFVTSVGVEPKAGFSHPLLAFQPTLAPQLRELLDTLKRMSHTLVISRAEVQQLEQRGKRVVAGILEEMLNDPGHLIPKQSWEDGDLTATKERRVCDYVAGMTDSYAERVYRRLFIPGSGSSRDEL